MAKKIKTDAPNEDILIDVKEQMAEDRRNYLLKRYGTFAGYCAVAIIILFGGYEAWKTYDSSIREEMGDKLVLAITDQNADVNLADYEGKSGITQIAKMNSAAKLAEDNKIDEAIAVYESIWAEGNAEPSVQKLAKIHAAILMLNSSKTETPAWLNSSSDNIFDSHFNELVAAYAMKNSNNDKAEKVLNSLIDNEETIATVRNRANAYLSEIKNN